MEGQTITELTETLFQLEAPPIDGVTLTQNSNPPYKSLKSPLP